MFIKKGSRIRAVWFETHEASLAGMQDKIGAVSGTVSGTITHVRGDHPTNPTTIRLWVQPDDGGNEVIVNPDHVVEHLPQ